MKWLNSLDELLYEVMSWLLFFPITLFRAVFRPIDIMAQINSEAALPEDKQYASVLSPPLFLALALLFAHTVSTALGQTDQVIASHRGLADLVNDNASALVLRVVIFASFPLFLAARLVRHSNIKLDRGSLRQPFSGQCYPAAVFALGVSIGDRDVVPGPERLRRDDDLRVAAMRQRLCEPPHAWSASAARWISVANALAADCRISLFIEAPSPVASSRQQATACAWSR